MNEAKFKKDQIVWSLKHNKTVKILDVHQDPWILDKVSVRYLVECLINLTTHRIPEAGLISLEDHQQRVSSINKGDVIYFFRYNTARSKYQLLEGKVTSLTDGFIFVEERFQLLPYHCFKEKLEAILSLEE